MASSTTPPASTMAEMMGLRWSADKRDDGVARLQSVFPLPLLAPWMDLAYGGGLLAMAINAASQTLHANADTMALYSVLGHFLGGADRHVTLHLEVRRIRGTRTFATRHVMLWQQRADSQRRNCFSVQVDFIDTAHDRTMLQYQTDPRGAITHHTQLRTFRDELDERVRNGNLEAHVRDEHHEGKRCVDGFVTSKYPPESVAWHNVDGRQFPVSTPQDALAITQKACYEWFQARFPIETGYSLHNGQQVLLPPSKRLASAAFLAFYLDGYLSIAPIVMSNISIFSAAAALTLEIALRFPLNDLDASQWYLRQITTIVSANERTVGETACWQESADGKLQLVAHMTQATVLRKAKL